jgi:5-methyltetrahydrofolate--homocysteine methyltransferase
MTANYIPEVELMRDFYELLSEGFVLLDGAMGTVLQKKGLLAGAAPELLNLTEPALIASVHRSYCAAGSQIIYTNTFGANAHKLRYVPGAPPVRDIVQAAVSLAREAVDEAQQSGIAPKSLVALDIGPSGELLEPLGSLGFTEAYELFREQVSAGVEAGADLIALETMTDLGEMRAAVLAARENSDLPIIATMTFEKGSRTFTGTSIPSMALTLSGLGVAALGFNCSLGPAEMLPMVAQLRRWTALPLIVKPNAGLPDPTTDTYTTSPEEFADLLAALAELGVQIMGGCCGTTPEYIQALSSRLAEMKFVRQQITVPPALCSASRVVTLDRVRVIGERINPTGKKNMQQALRERNIDYVLKQALEQERAGADILDVNLGMPDIPEADMMTRIVTALQAVTDLPLEIDSSSHAVLDAGLRAYHGKAVVNSVNGEAAVMENVFPLVKKYGAAVVGLTMDEHGIPATADERLLIARRILERALSYGIPAADVYIDCLTLTASAEQAGAGETLKALRLVREELGLQTVLGVSNISFGLPRRDLLNQTFLTLALGQGLSLPIMNPNAESMMAAVRAYHLLTNIDKEARDFIAHYAQITSDTVTGPTSSEQSPRNPATLAAAVTAGLTGEALSLTEELLVTVEPLSLINETLIPALDHIGAEFAAGRVFLPQLIQAAQAAQSALTAIKKRLPAVKSETQRETIILATVKGDVHDIGKNIVKTLLENYGYAIIDLGKDVPPEVIVETASQYKARLIGLSALMTTTLPAMRQTIALLKASGEDYRTMVGGAVLTPDYATGIGADYYAADAKGAVDIARLVFAE